MTRDSGHITVAACIALALFSACAEAEQVDAVTRDAASAHATPAAGGGGAVGRGGAGGSSGAAMAAAGSAGAGGSGGAAMAAAGSAGAVSDAALDGDGSAGGSGSAATPDAAGDADTSSSAGLGGGGAAGSATLQDADKGGAGGGGGSAGQTVADARADREVGGAAGSAGDGSPPDAARDAARDADSAGGVPVCAAGDACPACAEQRCARLACSLCRDQNGNNCTSACQAILACVVAHPGCATASSPICFTECSSVINAQSGGSPPQDWTRNLITCACF